MILFFQLHVLLHKFDVFRQQIIVIIKAIKLEGRVLRLEARLDNRGSLVRKITIVDEKFLRLQLLLDAGNSAAELLRLLLVSHRGVDISKGLEALQEQFCFGVVLKMIQEQVSHFVLHDRFGKLAIIFMFLASIKQPHHMLIDVILDEVAEFEEAFESWG